MNSFNHKSFHYYPVNIRNSYSGKNVKGFKFPANGDVYDSNNAADVENLQQFQLYFGVNDVINSIHDLIRLGTKKTDKIFRPLLQELINDYALQSVSVLTLASSMCWIPDGKGTGFINKLSPERALYEIQPAMEGLLLAIQTKMDLTFPKEIVKNIARLEIQKEIIDMKENVPRA